MRILCEDELVEAVIGLCITGRMAGVSAEDRARFFRDRDRCYEIADGDRRTESFARVHLDWFGRWGLRARLETAAGPFPELSSRVEALVFRRARGRHDEGAELYRDAEGCPRGVVALRADRVVSEPALTGFLNHELAHLEDMVTPAFGYTAEVAAGPVTASQERLIRERYRVIWAIRIDGLLARRGVTGFVAEDRRRADFEKSFGFLEETRRMEVFDGLWSGSLGTHGELMQLAADPRELEGRREPLPGAPCPLCGFAAFRWSDASGLRPSALERIRAEFPDWRPGEPLCARCAEIYESVDGVEYPSTVCLSHRLVPGSRLSPELTVSRNGDSPARLI